MAQTSITKRKRVSALPGLDGAGRGEAAPASAPGTLRGVATLLASQMNVLQSADVAPTAKTLAAVMTALRAGDEVMARWAALTAKDLPALNATLKAAGLPGIGGRPGLLAQEGRVARRD